MQIKVLKSTIRPLRVLNMIMMIMIKVKKKKKMMMTILKGKSSSRQNEKTFGTLPLTGLVQREKDWQICKIAENKKNMLKKQVVMVRSSSVGKKTKTAPPQNGRV